MSDIFNLGEIDDFAYRVWKAIETKRDDAAREKIKARDAAQRQAGREEGVESCGAMVRKIDELHVQISELAGRYAALVKAARKRIATSCVTCGWKHQCGGCAYAEIRKALRDLDEAKGAPHA